MAIGRTVHRGTWRSVDRFLALTPFHAEFLRSIGVDADRITVRPTSAPDPGPASPPENTDVVFAGRLEEQKGVRLLLDAWRSADHPAGAVVIPSTWCEGLPRVLVEAAAHGRALAVSDLGGLGPSVPDMAGWRFAPEVGALRRTLEQISLDAVRAKGAAARETYLSTYAPDVTTGQLLDVYQRLAGSRT